MKTTAAARDLELVDSDARAVVLMHPLRRQILRLAATPASATQIAAQLGLPRQKVNYHVRELASARFLRRAGRTRKRNAIEQRYIATARAYVLLPQVLGELEPHAQRMTDRASADYLVALAARLQRDVAMVMAGAAATEQRVATLSIEADIRFDSAEQREGFAIALRDAVTRVIADHSTPTNASGAGRPFRLALGCHPMPGTTATPDTGVRDD
jgi:hypothetical protein